MPSSYEEVPASRDPSCCYAMLLLLLLFPPPTYLPTPGEHQIPFFWGDKKNFILFFLGEGTAGPRVSRACVFRVGACGKICSTRLSAILFFYSCCCCCPPQVHIIKRHLTSRHTQSQEEKMK